MLRSRFLVSLAAASILVSCKSRDARPAAVQQLRPLNLVLITIDTLRAGRLHCYGNSRIETPALDRLAGKGVLFENAVAQAPLTPPSHASIFTGTYPTVHHVRNTGGFVLQPSSITLATILQQEGWDTAGFIGASVLKKYFGFNQGFAVYDDQMPKPEKSQEQRDEPERRASVVVDHALQWMSAQSGKPFFVWLHLYDPHEPYRPPEPFARKYRDNLYDGEVAYTDQQIGRFLDALERKSPPERTLVVALADHGESLGDHGEYSHGVFLYDSTLRIPFLMAGPGVPAGLHVKQQVRTIDVLPTILDLMGGKPPAACQGQSLVPAFSGKQLPAVYSYAETLYPKINMGWAELRGIRTARWKYVRAPKPELYDLTQDPGETTNVIDAHPREFHELDAKLKALSPAAAEKVSTVPGDPRTMAQLKSLGYLSGYAARELELTGKGPDPKDHVGTLEALQVTLGPGSNRLPSTRRVDILRQALARDSANPTLYFYLGGEYEKAGRYDQALLIYQEAINKNIRNGRLFSRIGDLSLRKGDKEQAIAAYEKAAQYNPADYESQVNLATAYLEKGKLEDADRVFRWVLTTDDYAPAHNGLGLVAIQRRDPATARLEFERAVALDPDLVEAQLNLGLIYKMAGDTPRAKMCFEAFLAKASRTQYARIIPQVREEVAAMR